jgi:hypothetical protein
MADEICYLAKEEGRHVLAYIDDYVGVAHTKELADSDFNDNRKLFINLGVVEAIPKELKPTQRGQWIGIIFDTLKMTMEIPPAKLEEIRRLLLEWQGKHRATRRELQSILGKLHFISRCCKPARLFVSRMLATLRRAHATPIVELGDEFMKDINWFIVSMPSYNGIQYIPPPEHNFTLEVDACLTGTGGVSLPYYYQAIIPDFIQADQHAISQLEFLNIVVAIKLWGERYKDATLRVFCDNMAAISVLLTGKGVDKMMLSCAREIWLASVKWNINILPYHKPGKDMLIPDTLSRAHLSPAHQRRADELTTGLKHTVVCPRLFKLCESI